MTTVTFSLNRLGQKQMSIVSLSTWSLRKVLRLCQQGGRLFQPPVFCRNGLQSLSPTPPPFFSTGSLLADPPPSKDWTSGKSPASSGSKCGESGGAASSGIPFLVKCKV